MGMKEDESETVFERQEIKIGDVLYLEPSQAAHAVPNSAPTDDLPLCLALLHRQVP